jgi:uncharacterized protein YgbK (DUF1537 family)
MSQPDLASLPPPPIGGAFARIRERVAAGARKLVVLDDDPTGTQTVHGVPVFTGWSTDLLAGALAEPGPCFFLLTNSRALPPAAAAALAREIGGNLRAASLATGRSFSIVSRGDSTLRGHYPVETDALAEALGSPFDGTLLVPAFMEGGRLTIDGIHYVASGDRLTPAGETEFARDATFGYRASALRDWVEEKTSGRVPAAAVVCLGLPLLRGQAGPSAVRDALLAVPRGSVVAADAVVYGDLEVLVLGLLEAEAAGRQFLARTAASFVRVRAGIAPRPLLEARELAGPAGVGGLVIVGSYVKRSSEQLAAVIDLPGVAAEEVRVDALAEPDSRQGEIARAAAAADAAIRAGRTAVLFTSRKERSAVGVAGDLTAARIVSDSLVRILRSITVRPRFLVAKGGITSSDLATDGLGVKRALVLGQAAPGIPVWQCGPETRFPGLGYIIFPGNVGTADTLRELVHRLA